MAPDVHTQPCAQVNTELRWFSPSFLFPRESSRSWMVQVQCDHDLGDPGRLPLGQCGQLYAPGSPDPHLWRSGASTCSWGGHRGVQGPGVPSQFTQVFPESPAGSVSGTCCCAWQRSPSLNHWSACSETKRLLSGPCGRRWLPLSALANSKSASPQARKDPAGISTGSGVRSVEHFGKG
ncbi:hypothetical protein H1C71_011988 [Ictidomys tridecemlineatus]|nr:hypothetical protein H1C71_011988 [Ictidomys tridecemlineatus]